MYLVSSLLSALPHIRHGFFTREGGVSEGIYASLNCGPGSGDNPAHINENRARVAASLGVASSHLHTLYQVHGNTVVTVKDPPSNDRPQADAMATDRPGQALGILTADCVPILFADSKNPIIGAAHAGWKGAVSGVAEATIDAMLALGAKREHIIAAIGPAIGKTSYEVGPEFHARFIKEAACNAAFFSPSSNPGHHYFDITAYVKERLASAGISRVEILAHDTCAEEQRFFSYRRATLRGEKDYGRHISAIRIV